MIPQRIVSDVDYHLPTRPIIRSGGSLLIVIGLPGAGKSTLVDQLSTQMTPVIVRTDQVRRFVREEPTYTAAEMVLVYEICVAVIARRLARGQRVIFDASNYMALYRRRLGSLAQRLGSALAVCRVHASEDVTRARLEQRADETIGPTNWSDAGWSVYRWMVKAQEPVMMDHLTIDTSTGSVASLGGQMLSYWKKREAETERNHYLQSAGGSGGYGHNP